MKIPETFRLRNNILMLSLYRHFHAIYASIFGIRSGQKLCAGKFLLSVLTAVSASGRNCYVDRGSRPIAGKALHLRNFSVRYRTKTFAGGISVTPLFYLFTMPSYVGKKLWTLLCGG
jgi:hypothetical protein